MMLLSFSETKTSFDPPSAHFLAQSALSMSLTPHFSSLTQPLILVALGDLLSLAMDADVKNAIANKMIRSFFICNLSPWRIFRGKLRFRGLLPDCTYGVRAAEKVTGKLEGGTDWKRLGSKRRTVRIPTFSVPKSVVKAQPGQQAGYKLPLPGEHSEAFLVLLFQWFWDHSLNF